MSNSMEIQDKLLKAAALLAEAGKLAEEDHQELTFMGMVFEPKFGWFSPDGELQDESDWNHSACVIGSKFHSAYSMSGRVDSMSGRVDSK